MFQKTVEQSEHLEGSIRLRTMRFYLTRFYSNNLAYFTGNGVSYRSMYEIKTMTYEQKYGFFLHDIGLVGEYVKYGAVLVLAAIIILVKAIGARMKEEFIFAKYHFVAILLVMFTAGGAFASFGEAVVLNCLMMYVIDKEALGKGEAKVKEAP